MKKLIDRAERALAKRCKGGDLIHVGGITTAGTTDWPTSRPWRQQTATGSARRF